MLTKSSRLKQEKLHWLAPPSAMTVEEIEQEVALLLERQRRLETGEAIPPRPTVTIDRTPTPLAMAQYIDSKYRSRPHIEYLSDRLAKAMTDVENGVSRKIAISMPPRMGKSQLASVYFPFWVLTRHPDYKIGILSHSPDLATLWGRQVRRLIEEKGHDFNLAIASDAGAVSSWQTTEQGGVSSRSAPGQSVTGLGFNVMLMDDLVKDAAQAHSEAARNAIWDYWLSAAQTRLEPPSLVIAIGTRWHEDDIIGRLLSPDYEGDPDEWEVISFPAIAEQNDVLGRHEGQPLYSPLLDETEQEAIDRLEETRRSVGTYMWSALYQQHPVPASGSVFDVSWFNFWTTDPAKATDDGHVIYWDPSRAQAGTWVDSWDLTFSKSETSDYVVGQRWCRDGANRFLVAQQRGRWAFTEQVRRFEEWGRPGSESMSSPSPYGRFVGRRLVEKAANGAALIDTLRRRIAGIQPVVPMGSKTVRARAITPEVESGNVFLPLPSDGDNGWVSDLLGELRDFPNGVHDDQVDALTQALFALRVDSGVARVSVPRDGRRSGGVRRLSQRL